MKFGKVATDELDGLNLDLPPDAPETTALLSTFEKPDKPQVYVGCAKWGRKEWVGQIYPKGTKDKDFLQHYINHFNGIELNATFYGMKRSSVESWAEKVDGAEDFKFCPKFSQRISHHKRLNDAEELTDYYLDAMGSLGQYLGSCFLQMPENFAAKRFENLQNYIEYLPNDAPVNLELRHTEWFTDESVANETFALLQENNIGTVITDVAGRRDCLHQRLTNNTAFIRFNGYDLHESDYKRLDDWADRIKIWLESGLKTVYFFVHQEDETHSPLTAEYMVKQLNAKCNLNLKAPGFLPPEE